MRTLQNFKGINNVQSSEDIGNDELAVATNVDIDLAGHVQRRGGRTQQSALAHRNLWKTAAGFTLATSGIAGNLVHVETNAVLVPGLGHTRLWFCNLPDGRTAYSNGTAQGVVNAAGSATSAWGAPIPATLGTAVDAAGQLHPGKYQYSITHVRLADGLEGGPAYSAAPVDVVNGGIAFTGLPVPAGYRTNVYLTSHYGGERFLAGSTVTGLFAFTGKNSDLQLPCRTEFMRPPPAGRLVAFWRGRALVAVGNALFASRPHSWELFDLQRDFKQFSGELTLVQPVDGGIFVGTDKELAFLRGNQFDQLVYSSLAPGAVVLGSGVAVPGKHLIRGDGTAGQNDGLVCIADGSLVAGYADGAIAALTERRYQTDATEVAATFRIVGGIPQYVAIPQ